MSLETRLAKIEAKAPEPQARDERLEPAYLHVLWPCFIYRVEESDAPPEAPWKYDVETAQLANFLRAIDEAPDVDAALARVLAWVDRTPPQRCYATDPCCVGYYRFSRASYLREVWRHWTWRHGMTNRGGDLTPHPTEEHILGLIREELEFDRTSGDMMTWPWVRARTV